MIKHLPTKTDIIAKNYLMELQIFHPYELNIENICCKENIDYQFGFTSAYAKLCGYQMISINNKKHSKEQHFEFLHEISHVILDHDLISSDYKQEIKANILATSLAIPIHMLKYLDFTSDVLIADTSDLFNIPPEIVICRLESLKEYIEEIFF